jgi:hypothetical protein
MVIAMRKPLRIGVLVLGVFGCGNGDSAPTSQFEIVGHVLDDLTGHGVEHATVSFTSDTLDRAETMTEIDGRFSFTVSVREGVDFGLVSASQANYVPSAASTLYFDGTEHALTLRLRAKIPTK